MQLEGVGPGAMLAKVQDSAGINGSVTTTLVSVTLPVLKARKVKVIVWPKVVNGDGDADFVRSTPGSSITGTVAVEDGALMVVEPLNGNDAVAVLRTTPAFNCACVGL